MNSNAEKMNLAAEGLIDVWEAAEFLSVSRSTIYKLMESGELRFAKIGKSRRITRRSLKEFAERSLIGPAAAG